MMLKSRDAIGLLLLSWNRAKIREVVDMVLGIIHELPLLAPDSYPTKTVIQQTLSIFQLACQPVSYLIILIDFSTVHPVI